MNLKHFQKYTLSKNKNILNYTLHHFKQNKVTILLHPIIVL